MWSATAGPIGPLTSSTTARWAALAGPAKNAAIAEKIATDGVAARNRIMTIQGPEPGWDRIRVRPPNGAFIKSLYPAQTGASQRGAFTLQAVTQFGTSSATRELDFGDGYFNQRGGVSWPRLTSANTICQTPPPATEFGAAGSTGCASIPSARWPWTPFKRLIPGTP